MWSSVALMIDQAKKYINMNFLRATSDRKYYCPLGNFILPKAFGSVEFLSAGCDCQSVKMKSIFMPHFWDWQLPTDIHLNKLCECKKCCVMGHVSWQQLLTLNVRGPSYLGLTRSISWLLMPWLLTSPGQQQPWYWLCRICRSWSYLRKDFKYMCHINME